MDIMTPKTGLCAMRISGCLNQQRTTLESDTSGRYRFIRVVLLTTSIGLGLLGSGCDNCATTWSAEARSPDGHWLATAQTTQCGGPGTAYDGTAVDLEPVNASQAPKQVLLFSHQHATMNLKLEWVTPTHLHVTYGPSARPGDEARLDFQVVKMSGIDISVQEVPAPSDRSR